MTDREHELWAAIHDLRRRMDERERRERVGVWVDYSATSTITGWSAYTTKLLNYILDLPLVYVSFTIIGTSYAITASFTLPYTSVAAGGSAVVAIRVRDNTGARVVGLAALAADSATCNCYSDMAGAGWTAAGTKEIYGEVFYIAA